MNNAILIQGTCDKEEYYSDKYPTGSNSHWFPWLSKQLIIRDIHTVSVEVPYAYAPDYELWKKEFERFDITSKTILVGHSCGGGFLVRWLSESQNKVVGRVILVAPWIDPNYEKKNNFFKFTLDSDIAKRTSGLFVFGSSNDMKSVKDSINILRGKLQNIRYKEFEGYGHFCLEDMGGDSFPELLKQIIDE